MYEIKRLEEKDVDEVKKLLRISWLDTYARLLSDSIIQKVSLTWHSKENILRGLRNPKIFFAGYREDSKLLGIITVEKIDDELIQIHRLYVLPSYQRRGIGSKLLEAAINYFPKSKKAVLEVEEVNNKAISFYKKKGFSFAKRKSVKVDDEEIPCLVGELIL